MRSHPEHLEECVRQLVKAARAVLNTYKANSWQHQDLAKAVAFARPYADEAKSIAAGCQK